jgi:hypothetical protein
MPDEVNVPADHKPYSTAPCAKCGAFKVRCTLEDEPYDSGTYYDIHCEACGYRYVAAGHDA